MPAETVLRDVGVECVCLDIVLATYQVKFVFRHDQVEVSRHPANAAVAVRYFNIRGRSHFESHLATMATALVNGHVAISPSFSHTARLLFAGIAYKRTLRMPPR